MNCDIIWGLDFNWVVTFKHAFYFKLMLYVINVKIMLKNKIIIIMLIINNNISFIIIIKIIFKMYA